VLSTIAVQATPFAVAIDSRTNRAFVAALGYGAHSGGGVSVLDATTGVLLRTVPLTGNPGAVAIDTRSGHVFVGGVTGQSVTVLDATSGALLRTYPVGDGPHVIAVDERTGRVVVTNANVATITDTDRLIAGICSWGGLGRLLQQTPRCASAARVGTVSILDTRAGR